MIVDRERGAVDCGLSSPRHVHAFKPRVAPGRAVGAPLSRSARTGLLPDFPVGGLRTELVATHKPSAATVTQAGGMNVLPAFSYLVQGQAGEPGVTQRHAGLKRLPAPVGGGE